MLTKQVSVKLLGLLALGIWLLLMPLIGQRFLLLFVLAYINILLAVSMRISLTIGLWNFGIVGFMAVGAYTSSLLTSQLGVPFLVAFVAAGVVASITGLLLGLPSLRLRGVYFLLLTLAFAEVMRSAAIRWIPHRVYVPAISIGGVALSGVSHYYFVLFVTVGILFALYRLDNSRLGLTWKSISQADALAEAVGINTYRARVVNFMLSCFVAGLAGSMSAHTVRLVTPWDFTFTPMMYIAIWNFAGGLGHFSGAIVGALVLTLLVEPLSRLAYYETMVYAVVIILIVFVLPGGLITLPQKLPRFLRRLGLTRAVGA